MKSPTTSKYSTANKARAWAVAFGKARRLLEGSVGRRAMRMVTREDIRFGAFVRSLSTTAPTLLSIFDDDSVRSRLTKRIGPIAQELVEAIQAARKLTLSEEIRSVLNARSDNTGVIMRLGLLEGEPMTLQQAGEALGVTRERIRQKEAKIERRLAESKPYTPIVDNAMIALNAAVGNGVSELQVVEACLRDRGVLTEKEHAAQIIRFANLLGGCDYQITSFNGLVLIGRTKAVADFLVLRDNIRNILDEMTKDFGAVPLEGLRDALDQARSDTSPTDLILLVLRTLDDEIEWLEQDSWLRLRRNWSRIRNFALKVLSVAPSIRINDLRKGLQRHHRITHVPKASILGKMLVSDFQDIGLTFDGNWVKAAAAPEPKSTLSAVDRVIYDVLKANGGVMARVDLEAAVGKEGMPKGTFHVALGYSPVFDRLVKGVYAIRGVSVAPGVAESFAKSVARNRLARDYGHLPDGRVYIAQEMSRYAVDQSMIGPPAGMRIYVSDGVYSMQVDGGESPYEVRCSSDQIRFAAHALETYGVDPGDYVLLVFDTVRRRIQFSVGDESVLEKFSVPSDALEVS